MFDRRLITNFNWLLLLPLLLLIGASLINLYSISQASQINYFTRQLNYFGYGFCLVALILLVDYHYLKYVAIEAYLGSLIVLAAVLYMGREAGGAQRWLELGGFSFQPSEPVKMVMVIVLADYCSRRDYGPEGLNFLDLIVPAIILAIPFLLILKQPDLGTSLHIALTCGSMLLYIRVQTPALALSGLIGGLAFTIGGLKFNLIKPYHLERIKTLVNSGAATKDEVWQTAQSKIAIGSGQISGQGFLEGAQKAHGFLPAKETDFAFAVWATEWGFVGSVFLLGLFMWLIMAGLLVSRLNRDRFGSLLAVGFSALIFWQMFINIGMVTGILPVVGIPLPFISYGGTSVVVMMVSVGIILNVSMRKFRFQEKDLEGNSEICQEAPRLDAPPQPVFRPIRKPYAGSQARKNNANSQPWLKYLKDRKHL